MNRRATSLVLIALCVVLVVLLVWQRTQITKLQQQNAELRVELADVQRQPPVEPAKPTPPVPDPELLRLRAEVAELRRQKTELARATPGSHARSEVGSTEADKLPFEIRVQQTTRGMMRLV